MRARCWLGVVALIACGAPPAQRLGPAGSRYDDGTGQLAAASVRLEVGGEEATPFADRRPRRYLDGDASAYGGYGYGGYGYGGFAYGGIGFGYGPPVAPPPPYNPSGVIDGGAVVGAVRWKADGGLAWPEGCDAARVARAGAPVAGAVAYLEGVTAGRAVPYAMSFVRTGGVLVVDSCALVPTVQTVSPLPGQVIIENADQHPARLVGERAGMTTTLELEAGARQTLAIDRVGALRVDDGRRAPAWVIGQAHPYYVISDADGRFALDDVPPGSYELVVWYPPLVARIGTGGPEWTAPTIERRRITVGKRGVARVDVALTPAR
ncbi:MAG TPA: hypothetical protein VM734_21965 [Kofleriaceae bacterium]|nr:hypothetical protein [Kofleriaceae bacterium]